MSGGHLKRLGDHVPVSIPTDANGYVGRECPNDDCLGYFKVMDGTGMTGITTCVCPYCGTKEEHDQFLTKDQVEYVKSVVMRKVTDAVAKDLKAMEFEVKPPKNAMFGIGISLKVRNGRPSPIYQYAEKRLETIVECDRCKLDFTIYGVFGYCPDCGTHNNLRILEANLYLVQKMLTLAACQDDESLAGKLIENALEDCVSAFDGWGRATLAVFAAKAAEPAKANKTSFQNLRGAQKRVLDLFGYDLESAVSRAEFEGAHTLFQKRHLIAHKLGVVDQAYVDSTGDASLATGRKVTVDPAEIEAMVEVLRHIAEELRTHLERP